MTELSAFSETYLDARAKFLTAASGLNATVTSYQHLEQSGPGGEELHFDVVRLGASDAEHVLVVGSGTHGIEGYPGSAAQTNWMKSFDIQSLPKNVGVIFTHAHNPWGFANALRCTEENVDLNRNFIDFEQPLPSNPNYPLVHEAIARPRWDVSEFETVLDKLNSLRTSVGEQGYSDALNGGQYSHQDGIFYGGAKTQWSNHAFRRFVTEHLQGTKSVAMIDLHTGIGPDLGHIFLCFHPPGSAGYERARNWWGERAINHDGVTHKAVANYQGLLVDAFVAMLPQQQTTAIVVEFGTLPREQMLRASMAARWLWASGTTDGPLRKELMRQIREAYYPSSEEWRSAVLTQSKAIIDRGLAGIAQFR